LAEVNIELVIYFSVFAYVDRSNDEPWTRNKNLTIVRN
jgi:hypothetical protein